MQAIILSGGLGTRLLPLTLKTPKPMLPINGVPHLEYQIRLLKKHGITDIIFSTGYLHSQIEDYFGNGSKFGVNIRYQEDGDEPLGTGGAIKNCEKLIIGSGVIVLNGDILTNINIEHMYQSVPISIALVAVEDPTQYGVAVIDKNKRIREFIEKPEDRSFGNLINAGIYFIQKEVITNLIPNGFSMIENTIFPMFAKAGLLGACVFENAYWLDIGTHDRYKQAQEEVKIFFK